MNRWFAIGTTVLGMTLAAVPAVAGLRDNPSFSHQLPVRVPTQAGAVRLVGDDQRASSDPTSSDPTSPVPTSPVPTSSGPASVRPTSTQPPSARPTDVPDAQVGKHPEPSDDHGGATATARSGQPDNDRHDNDRHDNGRHDNDDGDG